MRDRIRFLLNGKQVTVTDVATTRSLLSWLRAQPGLTGTKEGCAEGDCGACTVVVGELCGADATLQLRSMNACIQFVPALDGKAVFTVEYLRQQSGGALHPVQQAMVDSHGSQCGFCTPGFVMSLWDLYNHHQAGDTVPSDGLIRSAITGNLCRCTGYRPIIEAGRNMFDLPAVTLDRTALRADLLTLRHDDALDYVHAGQHFHAPRTTEELSRLRAAKPDATLLAGCTDIGLWINKQFRDVGDLIHIGQIDALRVIREYDGRLHIGAGASLTDAYVALARHYPQLAEMWERFASPPVRNAGTLGGNIANGSPIGDSMPALIVVGARVVLQSVRGLRALPLEALYLDYMKKDMACDEFVASIEIPLPVSTLQFRTYKLSKRFDSDISAVCAAFAIELDGTTITSARIAFGGMAGTPKRAPTTEAALIGHAWDEASLANGQRALSSDYAPLSDMRASADYRLRSAANLLQRFYLETRPGDPLPSQAVNVFADAVNHP